MTTVTDDTFSDRVEAFNQSVKEAEGDPCKLAVAMASEPPFPANSNQAKQLVSTYELLLKGVAKALPESSSENVKALNEAAQQVVELGKAKNYSANLFSSEELGKIMTSEGFGAAINEFTSLTQNCSTASTEDGATSPSTTEG